MVKITYQGENAEKAAAILEAAQKRFGMYGIEKTTMQEIADDLHLSKGALYYYFPDKEQLYKAVVEKEQRLFMENATAFVKQKEDPEEILRQYAWLRQEYFRNLANLSRMRTSDFQSMKTVLGSSWQNFQDFEASFVSNIISIGVQNGKFRSDDPYRDAVLFLEILRGLRMVLMKSKTMMYVEESDFQNLRKKVQRFTELFIKGLKS